MRYNSQRVITAQTARIGLADESVYLRGDEPKTALRAVLLALALCAPLAACDGNAFCPDCKACPSLCQAGYVCKEATLLEFGGAKSYHCGLAETKPALTVPDSTPRTDGGMCDAGDAAICRSTP